jgi:hypothetical protein
MPKNKPSPDVSHIAPALRALAVPISRLKEDAANARRHPERNLSAMVESLRRFGQQKPVVVDAHGVVIAGNGLLRAAAQLGWTHLAAARFDLKGPHLRAYAIADNRAGDLSEFDEEVLASQLTALQEGGMDLGDLGFLDEELEEFRGAPAESDHEAGRAGRTKLDQKFLDHPPAWTWVLLGIETIRFGEISKALDSIKDVKGLLLKTTVSDAHKD